MADNGEEKMMKVFTELMERIKNKEAKIEEKEKEIKDLQKQITDLDDECTSLTIELMESEGQL